MEQKQENNSIIFLVLALATLLRIAKKPYRTKKDFEKIEDIESKMWHWLSDGD